jgi:sigma-B regulation protein RsbU (phosphoserine phosphatase)
MVSTLSLAAFAQLHPYTPERWRWALFTLSLTVVLLTIGLTALAVFFLRRRSTNFALLYFSIFVVLYAVRMFVREGPLLAAFAIPLSLSNHIERFVTYTIVIPSLLVFLQDVDPRRKILFRITLAVQIVFAAIAIPADFLHIAPHSFDVANSILVLVFWLILVVFLFVIRPPGRLPLDLRVVAWGLAIFGIFVLHANLVGLRIIPGENLEPIGFLFFVCSLGYLVAHRISAREESLVSIQKELEIAQRIQSSILPREVPQLAGIEIAARYLPMSAVAGDFYDFLPVDSQHLGVLVADVTGHGVPAALIASMLKVAFAGQAAHASDPACVLTGLNQALCGKFEEHFVTAAYLYIDLEAKILRYAGAGHPPILVSARSNAPSNAVEHNGLFLGMFPAAEYSYLEIPLHIGGRCLVYTDGLPESHNASDEEFGLARFKQFLDTNASLPASTLADKLLSQIAQWSNRALGHQQEDDMTLLVFDFTAQASSR